MISVSKLKKMLPQISTTKSFNFPPHSITTKNYILNQINKCLNQIISENKPYNLRLFSFNSISRSSSIYLIILKHAILKNNTCFFFS